MGAWINVTPRLQQGLRIANQIDNGKFRLFVSRICQGLQYSADTKIFSKDEEEKLLVSLDLKKEDLALLLDAVTAIYMQAACNIVKPATMEASLKDLDVTDDKVSVFSHSWITYGKGIIDDLRQKSIFPTQVSDIDWCLNVQTSSSAVAKDAKPLALLQMSLTGEKNVKLTTEFDKRELIDLYHSLEKIQAQLDALK